LKAQVAYAICLLALDSLQTATPVLDLALSQEISSDMLKEMSNYLKVFLRSDNPPKGIHGFIARLEKAMIY
jgi:hypothetical protein